MRSKDGVMKNSNDNRLNIEEQRSQQAYLDRMANRNGRGNHHWIRRNIEADVKRTGRQTDGGAK